jgi:hypothetical protein
MLHPGISVLYFPDRLLAVCVSKSYFPFLRKLAQTRGKKKEEEKKKTTMLMQMRQR